MRKIYFFGLLISTLSAFSQNFGSFASGIRINSTIYNVTASSQLQQINQNSGAQNFDGANLGIFGQNSSCAKITAGEVKTFKNISSNVCSATLLWRVYPVGSPTGIFNTVPLSTIIECNIPVGTYNDGLGPCATGDQKWKDYSINLNFINSLTPGNYVLQIKFSYTGSNTSTSTCETTKTIDNSGAGFKATFAITNPTSAPTATPATLCEGDTLTLTANPSNGVAPYSYAWTGPNGFTSGLQNPSITTVLASAGVYSLVITDACGAVAVSQDTNAVTVNSKTDPTFDAIYPAICKGGNPPILPNLSTNGISGTWNPATVNNNNTANYLFTPNSGQCANPFTQTIFVINNVTPTFTLPTAICQGSTPPALQNNSNNGIQGTWSPATVSNNATGTYTYTPNTGQCATTKTVTITVTPIVNPTFTLPSSICQNAVAPTLPTISNNGISGTWNPANASNTASGTYVFTPNTASQCGTPYTYNLTVNPNLTPTFTPISPICTNATAPVLPTTSNNGYSGTWNPATVSNTASGIYTFTPNEGQCATSTTLSVTVNPNITPTFDPIPDVCYQITAPTLPTISNNGYTGTWNPSTVSNTASGTYTFTPTTGQCATTTTLNVTVTKITPTFNTIPPFCAGTTAPTLQNPSNEGITGTWTPSIISNTTSGTYNFIPNPNQCATTASISVTVTPNVTPTFTAIPPFCAGTTAPTLPTTSNNGYTGAWNPATVSNNTSGTYTFTPSEGQCATTTTLSVTVNPNITPTFTAIAPICSGATAPILPSTSTNGYVGTWNPATVSNTASGTYTFTPNEGQCATTTTLSVTVNPNITPIFSFQTTICSGATSPILPTTSDNGITGTWNPNIVSNTTSGNYTFTPASGNGPCVLTRTVAVTVNPNVTPTFNSIPDVCYQTTAPILPTTSTNGITGTWNPATVSNTASGTYTFTPNAGQCATPTSLNITVTKITPIFNPIPPICAGATSPILQNPSSNGITGIWNPSTVSNLASGDYIFTPDSNQCATTVTISVVVNPNVTPTFNAIPPFCSGSTAPTLPTTSNNGYSGTWNPAVVSNTTSGTYTFTPNGSQCATTANLSITVNPNVTPTFNEIAPFCAGTPAPGLQNPSNEGITGTWNPSTINNTSSGTYTFTPNAGQCATTTSISVTVTPIVTPTFNAIPDVCYQTTAPTLPTTSTNEITGTWNPAIISNTASGTYTFTPNANQCASTITLNVVVTKITPTFNSIPPVCYGTTPPTLQNPSNEGITGTWNPAVVSNTNSGTYNFTPDPNQCATTASISVTIFSVSPTFDTIPDICYGTSAPNLPTTSNNGIVGTWSPPVVSNTTSGSYTFNPNPGQCAIVYTITINVNTINPTFNSIPAFCSGSTAPVLQNPSSEGITGTWNPATVNNTTSDTYIFTPDANQCATTASISITVTPNITPLFNEFSPICYGSTAPTLPTTSTNGITGTWNPATISNTTAGTYTFTPNAGFCATTASITTTINTINPTFATITPVCFGSTAPTLQNPSNEGITGTWNPPTISNTTAGSYTFTPNPNQCATVAIISVTINSISPTFNTIAPICENSTAPVLQNQSNNGITGTWNPATVSNTSSGIYTFTPDPNQCALVTNISVTVNPIVTPTFNAIPNVCYNTTAPTLQNPSNNGISGIWNPTTVSNTSSGTYTFTPNSGECATTTSIQINVDTINPSFNINPNVCENGSVPTLNNNSNEGIIGSWNPATVSNTTSGNYIFSPNANQCATTTSVFITVNPNVTPTFNAIPPVCFGSTPPMLQNQSNEGISGTWIPATISNTTAGTYTFTPNAGICATSTTITTTINSVTPTFNEVATICYGATAPTLQNPSNEGITGTWNPATISNTSSGTYTFTPDANQCATEFLFTTTINVINPSFDSIQNVCYGSTPPVLPSISNNGISGTWNPATVSNTTAGDYLFTPYPNQCATTTTLSIGINSITPQFDSIPAFCENTTAPVLSLISNNGITGTWNPATVSNTTSGIYTFTPNPNQCAIVTFINITVTPRTVPTFTFGTTASVCQGSAVQVLLPTTSSNGISGTWTPNTVDTSSIGTTIYNFTPNPTECATTTNYTVTVNQNIIATFSPIAPICSGETAPILPTTSNNGFLGTWNPAIVNNSTSGTYIFTPNAGQCAVSSTLSIIINSSPTDIETIVANVLNNTAIGTIEITGITGGVSPYLFSINNSSFTTTLTYSNLSPGDYILTVQDANGCVFSKVITITSTCIFPNGISPNNDQKNDTFNLDGCNVKRLELFNRYGMKVNSFDDYVAQWDGATSDGKTLPDGTYFYVAELKDGTSKTGWVFIAR